MADPSKAVFLSYASQDAEAAKKICDALRAAGVEVWFDQSELRGGDAWDALIRKRIKECALFVPVISANTNARAEGYFRLEWKLAVDRSHLMADDAAFLFPIVIGDVADATARVPDKFRDVQWTRLRLDETPGELGVRVAKILGGGAPEDRGRRTEDREARSKRDQQPAWLRYAWAGVGLLFAVIFAVKPMWQTSRRSEPKPAAVVAPVAPAAPAVSEARQLVNRARAMSLDKYNSSADDFAAAESLIKRAIELDPNDATAWAVSSLLNFAFQSRGFDHAPGRAAAARAHAERALKLEPDLLEALFALGRWQRDYEDPAIAAQTLQKVLARDPNHAGALYNLAWIYERADRVDEAAVLYERYAAQPGQEALARYLEFLMYFHRARFAEAERCIRQSVAVEPSANSHAGLAIVLLTWKGDADGAARSLAGGPQGSRSEPRIIWTTAMVQLCQRAPEDVLKTLDRFQNDYIQDNWFAGPRAYFIGRAHALAGRKEAARLAWENGLGVMDARLRENPENREAHLMRGELLALLNRTDEALREASTVKELRRAAKGRLVDMTWFSSPARIYALLGRADEAVPLLTAQLAHGDQNVGWPLTPALLRLDPLWDKLRDDPRFKKLLADATAQEQAAAPPRDWPKNPELKKAIDLTEGLEAIPDDLALAEEITKRVLDRSPTDIEAVTVMARVQSHYLHRGFDRSDERAALAKRYAERALQLAPDEPEAMYALAAYHFSRATGETARTEQLLRRAMELDPSSPRPGRLLADLFNNTNRQAEAISQGQDNIRRFPHDVLSHYDLARTYKDQGRYDDFDRELDATLALAPLPNAIVWKARLQFGLRNDFAGMKAWLDRVPARVRGTERAVFGYFLYAVFGGDPEAGLGALRDFPQKWFTDFEYAGPTALLNAALLELQGKTELARRQYEAAQGEIQRMRQADPGRIGLSQVEFWTLLGVGRTEEAKVSYRRVVEGSRRPYAQDMVNGWWFTTIPAALLIGDRTTALTFLRESVATRPESRAAFRLRFQIDPRMAPFRADPEITALLAEPAGNQKTEIGGQKTAKPALEGK